MKTKLTKKEILCLEDAENYFLQLHEDHSLNRHFYFCKFEKGNESSFNIIARCYNKGYLKIGKKLNPDDWGTFPEYELEINKQIIKVTKNKNYEKRRDVY